MDRSLADQAGRDIGLCNNCLPANYSHVSGGV